MMMMIDDSYVLYLVARLTREASTPRSLVRKQRHLPPTGNGQLVHASLGTIPRGLYANLGAFVR